MVEEKRVPRINRYQLKSRNSFVAHFDKKLIDVLPFLAVYHNFTGRDGLRQIIARINSF